MKINFQTIQMRKIFFLLLFTISFVLFIQVNAQCNNELPKRPSVGWGPGGRPATECERLFYRKNYSLILRCFNSMGNYFETNYTNTAMPDSTIGMSDILDANKQYNIALTVQSGTEKNFFQDIKDLNWKYSIKTNYEVYTKAYNELINFFGEKGVDAYYKELLAKVGYDKMGKDSLLCKAAMLQNELANKFSFTTSMQGINIIEDKFENTHASFELLNIKNCAYAIRVIKNKIITDTQDTEQADINNHIDELHVYIGKWKVPKISIGKGFVVQNNFNLSQSKLSVQNLLIVIKCAPELQDEVLKQIDIEQLQRLIQQ